MYNKSVIWFWFAMLYNNSKVHYAPHDRVEEWGLLKMEMEKKIEKTRTVLTAKVPIVAVFLYKLSAEYF